MIREPAVSGTFYSEDPKELKATIQYYLKQVELNKKDTKGIISPHAGYVYSGKAAAYAHKALANSGYKDNILLMGPSHSGGDTSVWLGSDWATPIGKVDVNRELGRKISESKFIGINPDIHLDEHSLEVQLPFIQYLAKENKQNTPKIIPILFSNFLDVKYIRKISEDIFSVLKNESFNIVVSSDFTHYGFNYRYTPFLGSNIKDKIYDLDKKAIEFIEDLDTQGFVNYVKKTGATICGSVPISVGIEIAKKLGIKKGELLKYYTSGDETNSYNNSVSYASIRF